MRGIVRSIGFGLLILGAATVLVSFGCSDRTPVTSARSPSLPPQSSFVMDYEDFAAQQVSRESEAARTSLHWGYSAVCVGVWNTILTVTLAVPVAAYGESFKHEAVLQPDGSWQWTYNFTVGTVHTARLNGKIIGSEVHWKMYISKLNEYADYLWYSGISNLVGTSGTWTLNSNPNDLTPTPFLGLEWHRNTQNNTADLKYTNIIPEAAENGGYIFYGTTTDQIFNRYYQIYTKSLDNLNEMEWNFSTKAGRVKDPYHFGDAVWHCWDAALQDGLCE